MVKALGLDGLERVWFNVAVKKLKSGVKSLEFVRHTAQKNLQ